MESNRIRVVIDTNLWISSLIGKTLVGLLDILDAPEVETITSVELIEEVLAVANRPKFRKYFPHESIQILENWFKTTTQVTIDDIPQRCRDPKDDYLLELAVKSHAIYLVSGDDDLLSIGEIEGCRIMTIRQFVEELSIYVVNDEQ